MNTLLTLLAIGAIVLIVLGSLQVFRGPKQEPSPTDGLPASDFPEGWDRVAARKRIRRRNQVEGAYTGLFCFIFICLKFPPLGLCLLKKISAALSALAGLLT